MIKDNFVQLFENSFKAYWDCDMYSNYQEGETKTYSDIAWEINRLHHFFSTINIKPQDKIAILGRNSYQWATAFLATISYGAVVVPILPDFNPQDIHNIINHSESVFVFTGEILFKSLEPDKIPSVTGMISLVTLDVLLPERYTTAADAMVQTKNRFTNDEKARFSPDDIKFADVPNSNLMMINYTSGTTGFSKGVMLSANALAGNVTYAMRNIPIDKKSRMVSFLPLAHAYGCAFDFLMPVVMGIHVTFISKTPSPAMLIQAFKENKPQIIMMVPLIMEKIYKKQILSKIEKPVMRMLLALPGINLLIRKKIKHTLLETFGGNIREIVIGGAAFNHDAEKFFRKIKFPYTVGYGMTECGPLISYASAPEMRFASAGKILDIMDVKIESTDPFNQPGEILVRGENLMNGYYKNPEITSETIDHEGWLHTGDIGVIDKDHFVYIKGRNKSLILSNNGQNIYPEEIEAKLNSMHYVSESLVVENKQGKLIALVFPDFDAVEKHKLSADELAKQMEHNRKHLNKMVGSFEQITRIEIHPEEFQKTPKRSIKRFLYQIEK